MLKNIGQALFKFANSILYWVDSRTGGSVRAILSLARVTLYIGALTNGRLGKFGVWATLVSIRVNLFLYSLTEKDGTLTDKTILGVVSKGFHLHLTHESLVQLLRKAPDRVFPVLAYIFTKSEGLTDNKRFVYDAIWRGKDKIETAVLESGKEGALTDTHLRELLKSTGSGFARAIGFSHLSLEGAREYQSSIDEITLMLSYIDKGDTTLFRLETLHTFEYLVYRYGQCYFEDTLKDVWISEYFNTHYPDMHDLPLAWKIKLANTTLTQEIADRYAAGSSFLQKRNAFQNKYEERDSLGFTAEKQLELV